MAKLLVILATLACGMSWATSEQCDTSIAGSPVKFKLTSRRNQTGHWVAQVELERQTSPETTSENADELSVEVDQYTTVCEGSGSVKIIATITAPPPNPPSDYELFPGVGYYKFHNWSVVWEQARQTCAREGAHLAIINSEAESAMLKKLLKRYPKIEDAQHQGTAFLGFHDMGIEGQYFTLFGKPLHTTGFLRWSPGQPDNAGNNEDCGSILTDGGLNDLPCTGKHAFICEREL